MRRWMIPVLLGPVAVLAIERERDADLPEASSYRTELEEIIVRGQAPRWRDAQPEPELRPEEIEFFEGEPPARMEWLPAYTREERERYQGVRDRKNETPELKLFELRF